MANAGENNRNVSTDLRKQNRNPFCFPFYVETVENGAKVLETMIIVIDHGATEFRSPWNFMIYPQRDFTLDVCSGHFFWLLFLFKFTNKHIINNDNFIFTLRRTEHVRYLPSQIVLE